jgi:hypothetical protein
MKTKIVYGILIILLVTVGSVFAYYYSTSQSLINQLSDNQTRLTKSLNTVYGEYLKYSQPKIFKTEDDLIAWLNSNKDNQSLEGYMTLAKSQGVFMQVWAGWRAGTISGIDFSENWQKVKSNTSGVKYALMTIVGKQTYIIDLETKKLIAVEATNVVTWGNTSGK